MRKVYSYYVIKKYIEFDSDSDCILLTLENEYTTTKEKLKVKCKCLNVFYVTFYQFKNQSKTCCNDCSKKKQADKLKTNINDVIDFINNEDTGNGCHYLDGEYKNNESKLTIRCACGNTFITDFRTFKFSNKKQCNECGFKKKGQDRRIPYSEIKAFIEIHNCVLITPKDQYKNANQQLDIRCSCGNVFQNSYSLFKYGMKRRCNECYRKESSLRNTIPYSKIKSFVESESDCILLTPENEYINTHSNVELLCKCGNVFTTSIHEFKSDNKRQCNDCGRKFVTIEDFLSIFKDGDAINNCSLIDYENDNGYVYSRSIIKLQCACGEVFETNRDAFMKANKNRCDICTSFISKGEIKILTFLSENNIKNIREYKFDDCRGSRRALPFDFAIFHEDNLKCLIEYDGKQHFEPVNFGGSSDETALAEHENLKRNDQIKNKYCKENNIKLIRIPYWDFDNINDILSNELLHK